MPVVTYNAADVMMEVDGQIVTGFARDSFVKVEHDEDAWTKRVSADGLTSRAKANNYTGKITFTLHQTAESNVIMQKIYDKDKATSDGVVKISITDNSGNSKHVAAEGWPQKQPVAEFGAEEKDREWVFDCGEIVMTEGGNVTPLLSPV